MRTELRKWEKSEVNHEKHERHESGRGNGIRGGPRNKMEIGYTKRGGDAVAGRKKGPGGEARAGGGRDCFLLFRRVPVVGFGDLVEGDAGGVGGGDDFEFTEVDQGAANGLGFVFLGFEGGAAEGLDLGDVGGGEGVDLGGSGRVFLVGEGFGEAEHVRGAGKLGGVGAEIGGDEGALGGSGCGGEHAIGAAFDGARGQGAIPNIAEANGIAVVLEFQRAFGGESDRHGALQVAAGAFEWRGVLDKDSVAENGDVAGVDDLSVFENGATEDDVVDLKLTGLAEGVGEGRIDAVDGAGETVGVGGVVVIIEDLDLGESHEEYATVAAALAVAFDLGGGGPLDVELAVAEFFFGADIAGLWDALEGAVFNDPFGGCGGLAGLGI